MLAEFKNNCLLSFNLPSKKTKKTRETSLPLNNIVDGTGRFSSRLADHDKAHSDETGPEASGFGEHEEVSDAGSKDDVFGPFYDEADSDPDTRMEDSSSDCFPPLEDFKTSTRSRVAYTDIPSQGSAPSCSSLYSEADADI